MTSDDIRVKIEIDVDAKTIQLTDTHSYDSATGDYVVGVYELFDSAGNVVYKNADYDTPDKIIDPDIVVKSDIAATALNLPLNSASEIEEGEYTLGYKVNVPASYTDKTTSVEGVATDTIKATITSSEAADIVKLGCFEVKNHGTSGMNQVYTIVSMSYSGTVATFVVNETVPTAASGSTETITTFTSIANYELTKKFTYCLTKPTIDIDYLLDCDTPKFTSTDNTSYAATNNGESIGYSSMTRTHTLVPPTGSGLSTTTASTSEIEITNVWTNTWQTTTSTTVLWEAEQWSSSDTTVWYYITGVVAGADSSNVQCDTCGCEMDTCFSNLYNKWLVALATNPTEETGYREDLIKAITNWTLYRQAISCGEDTADYCAAMKAIFTANDCVCSSNSDGVSRQITGSTTTALFNKTYVVSGVPASSLGQNTDVAISDNYKVYTKSSGSWVESMDLKATENQRTWQQSFPLSLTQPNAARYYIPLNGDYTLSKIDYHITEIPDVDVSITFKGDTSTIVTDTVSKSGSLGDSTDVVITAIDVSGYADIVADTSASTATTGAIVVTYTFISQ